MRMKTWIYGWNDSVTDSRINKHKVKTIDYLFYG
jgi:hypothetical protein